MAQLLVRDLDDDLKARLKDHAARQGLSMEEAARRLLRQALEAEPAESGQGLGTRIASWFRKDGLDEPLPELRGQRVRIPDLSR